MDIFELLSIFWTTNLVSKKTITSLKFCGVFTDITEKSGHPLEIFARSRDPTDQKGRAVSERPPMFLHLFLFCSFSQKRVYCLRYSIHLNSILNYACLGGFTWTPGGLPFMAGSQSSPGDHGAAALRSAGRFQGKGDQTHVPRSGELVGFFGSFFVFFKSILGWKTWM